MICHAIWGVTPHLCELADGFAEGGYETLVPSLFDRLGGGFAERDTDPALYPRQNGFAEATRWGAEVLDLVQAAIAALPPPVFLIGFCFGGTTAWLAAARCQGLKAVSCFYGGDIIRYVAETPRVPTILHFGKTDPLIPPADVAAIGAAHPDLPIWLYDAGHAFVAPNGHHPDSAKLAMLRTLQLFQRAGGSRGEA